MRSYPSCTVTHNFGEKRFIVWLFFFFLFFFRNHSKLINLSIDLDLDRGGASLKSRLSQEVCVYLENVEVNSAVNQNF